MNDISAEACERRRMDIYKDVNTKLSVKLFWTIFGGFVLILVGILGAQWGYSFSLNDNINTINMELSRQEGLAEGAETANIINKKLNDINAILVKMQKD